MYVCSICKMQFRERSWAEKHKREIHYRDPIPDILGDFDRLMDDVMKLDAKP